MDSNLVCPARLERHPQEGVTREQLDDLEMRDRLARRVRVEGVALCVVAVAADRGVDRAAVRTGSAADEREILARHLSRLHHLLQTAVRLRRACDDEQAGS